MTNEDILPARKNVPGIVIFAAVLNFIAACLTALFLLLLTAAFIFGKIAQINQLVSERLSQLSAGAHVTYGLFFILAVAIAVALLFLAFFLIAGFGLLKAKKFAWYLQVTLSVLGLLGFLSGSVLSLMIPAIPVMALVNILILVLFFRASVRGFFGA